MWGALRRAAQGNDRAGVNVAHVSPVPDASLLRGASPLSDSVTAALVAQADAALSQSAPRLRLALGQMAMSGVGILKGEAIWAASALLHTSYFENPDVQDLIMLHICQSSSSSGPLPDEERERKHQDYRAGIVQIVKEWDAPVQRDAILVAQRKFLEAFSNVLKVHTFLDRFGVGSPAIAVFGTRLMLPWWKQRDWSDPRYPYPRSLYGRLPVRL